MKLLSARLLLIVLLSAGCSNPSEPEMEVSLPTPIEGRYFGFINVQEGFEVNVDSLSDLSGYREVLDIHFVLINGQTIVNAYVTQVDGYVDIGYETWAGIAEGKANLFTITVHVDSKWGASHVISFTATVDPNFLYVDLDREYKLRRISDDFKY